MKYQYLLLFIILLFSFILYIYLAKHYSIETIEGMVNSGDELVPNNEETYVNDERLANNSTYDNYDHYNGTSYPLIFYGPNGATARIIKTNNDNYIIITNSNGTTETYHIKDTQHIYYGKNGGSIRIITASNGKTTLVLKLPNNKEIIFYPENIYATSNYDNTINQYSSNTNTTGCDYQTAFNNTNTNTNSQTINGPGGSTYSTYDSSAYYNSLPDGIPKSQIIKGQEDLYILKSQVIPPVCPKCPEPIIYNTNDNTKCPPCPPCARCPEPAFDCKKVPNYSSINQDFLPIPVLNDFSTFGM